MPEIPEMETYKSMLAKTVVGKLITQIDVERPRSINLAVDEFTPTLHGQIIEKVSRRAKYLILQLHGGFSLITHMMLDGRLYYSEAGMPESLPGKPDVILNFTDGSKLYFCDLRLGFLHLVTSQQLQSELAGLGLEPLSPEFTFTNFMELFKKRRGVIKPLLIDQKIIAGIGNAYSNESLFAAAILPSRTVAQLQESEMKSLWQAILRVLREASANGGYIEEPYAAWDKLSGGHIPKFMVYDRGGEPCKVCGTLITETKIGGRWTYYCTACQK